MTKLQKNTTDKSISPAKDLRSNKAPSLNVSQYELQNNGVLDSREASVKKRSRTKSKTRFSAQGSLAVSDKSRSPNGMSKNVNQHSFKDLVVGRLKKQESQIIEKSCAKKKLQSEIDSKAESRSHDGHKISMEDCEPSPNKKTQASPKPTGAQATTIPAHPSDIDNQSEALRRDIQTVQEKEVQQLIFGNDNSSVLVYNNQDSQKRKSLNINMIKQSELALGFDASADLPNRNKVPSL